MNGRALVDPPSVIRRAPSPLTSEDLNDLGHDLELTFVITCEHDRSKSGIDGLEVDPRVAPGVAVPGLLALVALYGVTLAGLWVGGITELDEDGLALARACDGGGEETIGAIRDAGLHPLAHDLGNEHPRAQSVLGVDRDPLPAVVVDVLGITKCTGGSLERDERDAPGPVNESETPTVLSLVSNHE